MNKYLYSLSIAFVFCCSSVSLKAQTLTIGTGTTTTRAPFGSYYGYEYNAYIYTSPFLSGVSGAIVQIGFNVGAGTTLSQIPVTIKMKARALSDSSMTSQSYSTVSAGAKTVFQGVIGTGNLVTAGNYMLINLTDTFKLPASQNLMIFVENAYGNNGGWDSTTTLFRYTATTGNKAIKWFSDGAPPTANGDPNTKRPNTRIVFSNSNCAGTPTPGLTIHSFGTTNPACPGSTFTLSLGQSGTIFTPAQNTTYQWQSSSDGTNYSNIALATKPTLNTSQTSNTYYRCVVTCPTSASTATSTAVLVNTNVNGCYCVPVYQEGCNFGDEINGVQLNNLDKTDQNPNCTGGTAAYTYFSTDTAKLVKNGTQTLFIYLGSDLNNYAGAWIDYNTNGV